MEYEQAKEISRLKERIRELEKNQSYMLDGLKQLVDYLSLADEPQVKEIFKKGMPHEDLSYINRMPCID